jgi:FtsH-binding integral membrane protein
MNYQDYELKEYSSANERLWEASQAFPVLMRKVYVWMTLALAITGVTAYGVATSPGLMQVIYTNQALFWGLIIAEFALGM